MCTGVFVPFGYDRSRFKDIVPVITIPRPGLFMIKANGEREILDQNLGNTVNVDWLTEWNKLTPSKKAFDMAK